MRLVWNFYFFKMCGVIVFMVSVLIVLVIVSVLVVVVDNLNVNWNISGSKNGCVFCVMCVSDLVIIERWNVGMCVKWMLRIGVMVCFVCKIYVMFDIILVVIRFLVIIVMCGWLVSLNLNNKELSVMLDRIKLMWLNFVWIFLWIFGINIVVVMILIRLIGRLR